MPHELTDLDLDEVSLVDDPANAAAKVALFKRATKTEDGKAFPAGDYAYVPDPEKPSTWKLRLTSTPGGDPDPRIVGAAVAALGPGFRGQKASIPAADKAAVKAKVKAAWLKANPKKGKDDLPAVLKSASGIERIFEFFGKGSAFSDMLASMRARDDLHELSEELDRMMGALHMSIGQVMDDPEVEDKRAAIAASFGDFASAISEAAGEVEKGGDDMSKTEELEKALAEEKAAHAKTTEELAALKKADDPTDTVDKSKLTDAEREAIEKMEAVQKAQAEEIAKLREAAEIRDLTEIVKRDFPGLVGEPGEIASVLRDTRKALGEERYAKLQETLKAASAAGQALLKERGHGGGGSDEASAIEKANAKARELMEKDPKLSLEAARAKVWKSDPDLRKQAQSERAH